MKKVLILFLLLFSSSFADFRQIPFLEFVELFSHVSGRNVVVSDSVDKDMSIFMPTYDLSNKTLNFKILLSVLKNNGLDYKKVGNVYIIVKRIDKPSLPDLDLHLIKFHYLDSKDIKDLFSSLFPHVQYTILKNKIFVRCSGVVFIKIRDYIEKLDTSYLSSRINVVVVSTQNQKIRKLGLDTHFEKFFPHFRSFLKIISSDISFNTSIDSPIEFYTFINALSKKGYTTLIANPTLTLIDKRDALIESTTTLPFLTTTTTTQDARTSVQNTYDYKDVGLKLYFNNVVITQDFVSFDLDIYVQNVLEKSLTPVVSNKHIKTHVNLNDGLVVIGGINSSERYSIEKNIPIIEYVPLVNKITKYESTETNDYTFTIVLSRERSEHNATASALAR